MLKQAEEESVRYYKVDAQKPRFTIRVSASRLAKRLLAIPQKFKNLFPRENGQIKVVFDDGDRIKTLTFMPCDPRVKESRIFGLSRWFLKRNVQPGDVISVTVEDQRKGIYRIALDRFVRQRQEDRARKKIRSARTEGIAREGLRALVQLARKRPRHVAKEELLRIAQESPRQPRPTLSTRASYRYEGVPAGIRILLGEVHQGKCQVCSFAFKKRDGEPYFEIHHVDPQAGHHPSNLLLLCANCHAQFEHAKVTDFLWVSNWVVSVKINGKRFAVRQPLAGESSAKIVNGALLLLIGAQMGPLMTYAWAS